MNEDRGAWNDQASSRKNLRRLLGDEGYLRLIETYGGLRIHVPINPHRSVITDELTIQYSAPLSRELGGMYISVPIDRIFRVECYRKFGFSNRKIATLLKIAESSVDKIIRRTRPTAEEC